MNLDNKYTNVASCAFPDGDLNIPMNKAGDLYVDLGNFLASQELQKLTNDSIIRVNHKLYVNENNEIDYLHFQILDAKNKKMSKQYARVLAEFFKNRKLDVGLNEKHLICMTSTYLIQE